MFDLSDSGLKNKRSQIKTTFALKGGQLNIIKLAICS